MTQIKPYIGFSAGTGMEEGACLIFAHTAREAKKVVWPTLRNRLVEFPDVRVKKVEATEYIMSLAKKEEPHVIESPPVCEVCELWCVDPPEKCVCVVDRMPRK